MNSNYAGSMQLPCTRVRAIERDLEIKPWYGIRTIGLGQLSTLASYATYLCKTSGACRYQSQSTETWGKSRQWGHEIEGLWALRDSRVTR